MKRILVPTDFSPCAEAAAATGIQLAEKVSAEIYFLHLHLEQQDYHSHVPHNTKFSDENKHHQNSVLGRAAENLTLLEKKANAVGVKATKLLICHTGLEAIEDYVKPYRIDLIVMGSHGVKGIKEKLLGSNTQRLIRRSPVPILVIKERVENFDIHKIVFASTFEEDLIKPFEFLLAIAQKFNAEIFLLFVNTPDHFIETSNTIIEMNHFMDCFPGVAYTPEIYNAKEEASGIAEFSKQNQIDLIAIGTYGRRGLVRLLSPRIVEKVVNLEHRPVLVINTHTLADGEIAEEEKERAS